MSRPPGTDNSDHTPDTVPGQDHTPKVVPGLFRPHPLWFRTPPKWFRASSDHPPCGPDTIPAYATRPARNPRKNGILSYSSPLAPGTRSKLNPEFSFEFPPAGTPSRIFFKHRFFDEMKSGASLQVRRFAPAIPGPRRALRTYTHLPTHTHPHAHLTAIPAFPDAGGLGTRRGSRIGEPAAK